MKKLNQEQLFDFLSDNGIENFIGVPDSTLKHFIEQGLKKKKILIATREEEAIGIATGMLLSKSPSLIFLQNAGLVLYGQIFYILGAISWTAVGFYWNDKAVMLGSVIPATATAMTLIQTHITKMF